MRIITRAFHCLSQKMAVSLLLTCHWSKLVTWPCLSARTLEKEHLTQQGRKWMGINTGSTHNIYHSIPLDL